MDALPSREESVQETPDYKPSSLLTVDELPHILEESVYNGKRMSCSSPCLVLRQSIKPIQDCLDILLLEKLLYKSDYVVLSRVKC